MAKYKCSFDKDFNIRCEIEANSPELAAVSYLNDSERYENDETVFISDGRCVYEVYVSVNLIHTGEICATTDIKDWMRKNYVNPPRLMPSEIPTLADLQKF